MVTKTLDGCSYSELWVSPANWQKATKKDFAKSNNFRLSLYFLATISYYLLFTK